MVSPVTKSLSTRNATALAISSSPPQRPERRGPLHRRVLVGGGARRRHDRPRRDRVHEDLVGGQLERQCFGERLHAGLGHVVGEVARIARTAAGRDPVREVHDPSAAGAAHVRHGSAAAQERGPQVHRQLAVPVILVLFVERHMRVHRGHVHQDVEAAEGGSGFVDRRAALQRIAEVGVQRQGPAAARPHHRRGSLGGLR